MSIKRIRYKAVFIQDDQKDTVEYQEMGTVEDGKLCFQTKDYQIEIRYDEKRIALKQGQSVLKMHVDKEMWNEYQLPYGSVSLKTKVLMFQTSLNSLKLKYELYDSMSLLMSVYILVTMS